ncbi:MAG: carbonic anhydrase family protein [Alphaproteobacteria bacterium]
MMMKKICLGLAAVWLNAAPALAEEPHAAAGAPAHWEYIGETGAGKWGELGPEYALCAAGKMQSPIDLTDGFQAEGAPVILDYQPSALNIVHNGHTIQANFQPGGAMTVSGRRYALLQVHFHAPSEHALGGERAAMEAHFVHKSDDGKLAVLGLMMRTGAENPALEAVWQHMPTVAGPAQDIAGAVIDAKAFFPASLKYHRYMGSLTTPPCSEGVNWFVLDEPVNVGPAQLKKFVAATGENARPLQPVNNRLVLNPMGNAP